MYSLCQQGGLIALSVNRHPINMNISDYLNDQPSKGPQTRAAHLCANCSWKWKDSYIIVLIHLISITNANISI